MMKSINCFIFLVLSVFSCCRYDKIEPKCGELPPPQNNLGEYDYTMPKYHYTSPSFNPNNENEIAFYRLSPPEIAICIYNLQTHELRTIYKPQEGFGTGTPEWGNDNWIFFPMKDRQIWKIKANGDSLMQVTNNPLCFNPQLNTNFHKMIYYHFWNVSEFTGNIFISDEKGNVLDSIRGIMQLSAWQNSDNIALFSHLNSTNAIGTIQVLNPNTKERIDIGSYNFDGNSENGLCWIDNNTLFYILEDGVYKIDIPTQKTTQLRVTCETKNYTNPSYSLSSHKIVACKTTKKMVGDNLVEVNKKLCILDIEGNELEIIEIPE